MGLGVNGVTLRVDLRPDVKDGQHVCSLVEELGKGHIGTRASPVYAKTAPSACVERWSNGFCLPVSVTKDVVREAFSPTLEVTIGVEGFRVGVVLFLASDGPDKVCKYYKVGQVLGLSSQETCNQLSLWTFIRQGSRHPKSEKTYHIVLGNLVTINLVGIPSPVRQS